MAGGNSPSSYDQVSIRDMVMDDLDRFPEVIGKGHDPVSRARGRTKAFPHKYKLALVSTPTIKDASLIERPDWQAADAVDQFYDYLYLRDNPAGLHRELWFHEQGDRSWLVVTRNTLTHDITSVELARDVAKAKGRST